MTKVNISLNLNGYILVRLTPQGERLWAKAWEEASPTGVPEAIRKNNTLADGRIKFQLWDAMWIFGGGCYMGVSEIPFIGNQVEIEVKEEL